MKNLWKLLPAIIILSACDKVTNPIKPIQNNGKQQSDSSTYKLLIEDCMGHFCGNCPAASVIALSLASTNSHVIYIEDHFGFFADTAGQKGGPATPPGLPANAFREDLRCAAGNAWNSYFNFSGFPIGMVDRKYWTQTFPGTVGIQPGNWTAVADSLIAANPKASVIITIHDSCQVSQRMLNAQVTLNFLVSFGSNKYNLEMLMVEDSCKGWQVDYSATPQDDSAYMHRYVLRGAFGNNTGGNPWGDSIPNTITSGKGTFTKNYTYDFTNGENGKAAKWNLAHCYIVAFVSNSATYNIVQAEMIKVE